MNYIITRTSEKLKRFDLQEKPCDECQKIIAITYQNKKEPEYVINLSDDKLLSFVNKYDKIILTRDCRYIGFDYSIEILDREVII
jgi:hypothetical protein